ncbi:MAG: ABC transporter substrate-binding protein [Cetobacterium sp.]|uniref:ABC transporter substrate-binding protein n=1 Tax=Cetobacterium sp. TaxID=2071632 RepID=UPI003F3C0A2B
MLKKVKKFMVMGILGMLMVGCGSDNKTTLTKDGKMKMDIIAADDSLQGGALKKVIDKYEAENPNIDINLIELPYGDILTKVKMMISGGNPPALVRVTDAATFGSAVLELEPKLGENIVPSLKGYAYNKAGKLIAVPINSTANGLIINKTLFDKAGVKIPKEAMTWDNMEKILLEVKKSSDAKYPLVWDVSPSRWSTILYQYGGSFFDKSLKNSNFNSIEAYNALKKFKDLHENGIMPKSVWVGGEDPSSMFKGGIAVGILSGSWKISEFNKDINNFEWEVIPMPYGTVRSTVAGGNLMVAFKNSGMEDEAQKFLQFMRRDDIYKEFLKTGGFLSSFDNVNVISVDYISKKEAFEQFANDIEVSPEASGKEWGENVNIMTKIHPEIKLEIQRMVKGDISVEETQNIINQYIEETLKNQ